MNFYNILSNLYDDIFKLQPQVLKFINYGLDKNDKVLNLSCATGIYDLELFKEGIQIISIDVREAMISQYEKKINSRKIEYYNEDMRNINILFKEDKFKKVFCIDNSISYLESYWEFEDLINKIKNILENRGVFVFALNNYDKILKFKNFQLPLILNSNNKICLERYYKNIHKESMELINNLKISKGEVNLIVNKNIRITPFLKDTICNILSKVGYCNIKVYGDFNCNIWNENAELTIIEAQIKL
ncbi:methyltransferase domain-containing protein [Clostridium tarantellae]|uniref:Methyltransferase domain-containing protein n=1 Tax=Clostridium tarantellae TaxID=39493 RepID=A0A6I1MPH6_9CLOT|nr:methyltransferase domain-containing protein [Clostridium tarantellae]MPQ44974.1 methyltransferase domain-containing protein [Clostridium tarantellae]